MKLAILGTIVLTLAALADHDTDTVCDLERSARDLDTVVYYSTLRPNVKYAVSAFDQAAQAYVYCMERGGRGLSTEDHEGFPPAPPMSNCRYQQDQLRRTWYPVERYLNDTYYDYPAVHRQYLRTRSDVQRALYGMRGPR